MMQQLVPRNPERVFLSTILFVLAFPALTLAEDDVEWKGERLHSPLWRCLAEREQIGRELESCNATRDACSDELAWAKGQLELITDELKVCDASLAVCTEQLEACSAQQGNRTLLPPTGQTDCYGKNAVTANWELVDCEDPAAEGQDGEVQSREPSIDVRFTDNWNGTVTDELTGNIWLKDWGCAKGAPTPLNTDRTWVSALAFANMLQDGDCGLTDGSQSGDWHLPNRNELLSVVDISRFSPAVPQASPVFDHVTGVYWSSSTYINPNGNRNQAWGVNFGNGDTSIPLKDLPQAKAVAVRYSD